MSRPLASSEQRAMEPSKPPVLVSMSYVAASFSTARTAAGASACQERDGPTECREPGPLATSMPATFVETHRSDDLGNGGLGTQTEGGPLGIPLDGAQGLDLHDRLHGGSARSSGPTCYSRARRNGIRR